MVRKTIRISQQQHDRLLQLKNQMALTYGQKVSSQLAISKVLEAGLTALGFPRPKNTTDDD